MNDTGKQDEPLEDRFLHLRNARPGIGDGVTHHSPGTDGKTVPTPEEARWRASTCSPEKMRRNLRGLYVLLGIWSAVTLAWIVAVCLDRDNFSWWTVFVLLGGYLNGGAGIVNTRRLMDGKRPW